MYSFLLFNFLAAIIVKQASLFQNLNLAYHAECRSSSSYILNNSYFECRNAVDGDLSPLWQSQSCSSTLNELKPWTQIILDTPQLIRTIVVFGRVDCCHEQTANIVVSVGNNSDHVQNSLCGNYTVQSSGAFPCNLVGKYVTFWKQDSNHLTLCEILLYSEENIAIGKRAISSSQWRIKETMNSQAPIQRFDWSGIGRLEHYYESDWYSKKMFPYYMVDLGKEEFVSGVIYSPIYHAGLDRIQNYQVFIGNYLDHSKNTPCSGVYIGAQEIQCSLPGRYIIIRPTQWQIFNVAGLAILRGSHSTPTGYWKLLASGANDVEVNMEQGITYIDTTSQTSTTQTVVKWAITQGSFSFSITDMGGSVSYSLSPQVTKTISDMVETSVQQSITQSCSATCSNSGGIAYVYQWCMSGAALSGKVQFNNWEICTCHYVCRNSATLPKCPLSQCEDSTCSTCL